MHEIAVASMALDENECLDHEREPLFPNQEEPVFIDTMHVTRGIYAIRYLEKQISQYDRQLEEARFFYVAKKSRCEDRILFIKRSLMAFLQQNDMKNVQTPAGTAFQKEVTTKVWPPSEELVSWAVVHLPTAVRTKQEPDKRLIGEYIEANGDAPGGYEEKSETRLYIK